MPRTISDIIDDLQRRNLVGAKLYPSPPPEYSGQKADPKVMLAVEAMRRHTADAGWQLQIGLEQQGYRLCGYNLSYPKTNIKHLLSELDPATLVMQDKREWYGLTAGCKQETEMRFSNETYLTSKPNIFKLLVTKDSHALPQFSKESADNIETHGWIYYYHPRIVKCLAPYVRMEHSVRTSHSIEPKDVPGYRTFKHREGCVLSGAVSNAYPLRKQIIHNLDSLDNCIHRKHPGYHANGCRTPSYLKRLSMYKVAICTSSIFGYALRKLIEATACGCIVLTDLPVEEKLPVLEENLVRVDSVEDIRSILPHLYRTYNPEKQEWLAGRTKEHYDWRAVGARLAKKIEILRVNYNVMSDMDLLGRTEARAN